MDSNYTHNRFFFFVDQATVYNMHDYFVTDSEESGVRYCMVLRRSLVGSFHGKSLVYGVIEFLKKHKASSLKKSIALQLGVPTIEVQLYGCNNGFKAIKFMQTCSLFHGTSLDVVPPNLTKALLGLGDLQSRLSAEKLTRRDFEDACRTVAEFVSEDSILTLNDALLELPCLVCYENVIKKHIELLENSDPVLLKRYKEKRVEDEAAVKMITPVGIWIAGDPFLGKTFKVELVVNAIRQHFGDDSVYNKTLGKCRFFDGLKDEARMIVVDEFNWTKLAPHEVLNLVSPSTGVKRLDKKGTFTELREFRNLTILANNTLEHFTSLKAYEPFLLSVNNQALHRRFVHINLGKPTDEVLVQLGCKHMYDYTEKVIGEFVEDLIVDSVFDNLPWQKQSKKAQEEVTRANKRILGKLGVKEYINLASPERIATSQRVLKSRISDNLESAQKASEENVAIEIKGGGTVPASMYFGEIEGGPKPLTESKLNSGLGIPDIRYCNLQTPCGRGRQRQVENWTRMGKPGGFSRKVGPLAFELENGEKGDEEYEEAMSEYLEGLCSKYAEEASPRVRVLEFQAN
jgi:hypothetical protein